ncbi:unnamed protein product [Peronospora destructor]|uniref:Uncharacterized protein n=1 Tax=Peronospora destructor TaxID=86335 RepID=A0AAV0SWU3_9STRA|nr:unnamed protein product [Peronospora destructor]
MTFPNFINYRLQSRGKGADDEEKHQALCWQTSVQEYALFLLTQKLTAMISQQAKLLAVLVADCDGRTAKHIFWAKATAYQHSELDGLLCTS